MDISRIGVIGAGAWGTALASVIASKNNSKNSGKNTKAFIYTRNPKTLIDINENHENSLRLQKISLSENIKAIPSLREFYDFDLLLLALPSFAVRKCLQELSSYIDSSITLVICSKGIERKTGLLMHELALEILPRAKIAALSGPNFAIEIAKNLPAASTLACPDINLASYLSSVLSNNKFRIYASDDIIGCMLGGAAKNVIAIACGIVRGKRFGDNATAAIITRGNAEIIRLSQACGGKIKTMYGLSGLGDLCLTCFSNKSRNLSFGVDLTQGRSLTELLKENTIEGYYTAFSIIDRARKMNVEMPICEAVYDILIGKSEIDEAIDRLLSRSLTSE